MFGHKHISVLWSKIRWAQDDFSSMFKDSRIMIGLRVHGLGFGFRILDFLISNLAFVRPSVSRQNCRG